MTTLYATSNTITKTNSKIPLQTEKMYHQSYLIGTWSGNWANNKLPVKFKINSIDNGTAQVEYTQAGVTQKGRATVNKNVVTFGPVQIATKDGLAGVVLFSAGGYQQKATVTKEQAPPSALQSLLGKLA